MTPSELWTHVVVNDLTGCWIWCGRLDKDGYGRLSWHGRPTQAHRAAFEEIRGPIPRSLEIDHLCARRSCVNPAHLEPVTHAENMRRASVVFRARIRIAGCDHGEEAMVVKQHGRRACQICARQRYKRRNRAVADVRVGDIWRNRDRRDAGRTVRVIYVDQESATLEVLTKRGGGPPSARTRTPITVQRAGFNKIFASVDLSNRESS